MIRVLHLIDESAHEEGLRSLRHLLGRLAAPGYEHRIGLLGPVGKLDLGDGPRECLRFGRRWGWELASSLPIRAKCSSLGVNVIHAWSASAAAVAQLASEGRRPVVLTVNEPPVGSRWGRWVAATSGGDVAPAAVACSSELFRRRAIEAGLPPERCGVIRPAVDFAAINAAKRAVTRERLGIGPDWPVLLTAPPASREGGHYHVVWAAALLQQIWRDVRVIVPGVSEEGRRLLRFAASFRLPEMVMATEHRYSLEGLLGVCDVFVTAAGEDVPTEAMAWAMAAGVPIVGGAVPVIAEFIADHRNGLLCKPNDPVGIAGCVRAALRNRELAKRLGETARADAFEAFSLARMARHYGKLYDNVLVAARPFEGIEEKSAAS